jgi:hypothetical protein
MSINIPQSELDALEKAFQLMWDNFPEAVQLTYKNREVIALNKASLKLGRTTGTKCSFRGEAGRPLRLFERAKLLNNSVLKLGASKTQVKRNKR